MDARTGFEWSKWKYASDITSFLIYASSLMIADICTLKLKSINHLLKCQQQIITFFFFLKCKNVVNTQICTGSDVFLEENKLEKQAASGKNASSSSFRPSPEICQFPLISQQTRERLPPFLSLSLYRLSFFIHNFHITLLLFCRVTFFRQYKINICV